MKKIIAEGFADAMCTRITSSPGSIAGVPSGRVFQSYPITEHHSYVFKMQLEG